MNTLLEESTGDASAEFVGTSSDARDPKERAVRRILGDEHVSVAARSDSKWRWSQKDFL
jgi:hypothetical protein